MIRIRPSLIQNLPHTLGGGMPRVPLCSGSGTRYVATVRLFMLAGRQDTSRKECVVEGKRKESVRSNGWSATKDEISDGYASDVEDVETVSQYYCYDVEPEAPIVNVVSPVR